MKTTDRLNSGKFKRCYKTSNNTKLITMKNTVKIFLVA